jgi:hypothetical protein
MADIRRLCFWPAGTLINTEHLAPAADANRARDSAFILTANHCRGFDTDADAATFYSAVFGYQQQGCAAADSPGASQEASPVKQLVGLRVAWQDEASDVMLLGIDGAIPDGAAHAAFTDADSTR